MVSIVRLRLSLRNGAHQHGGQEHNEACPAGENCHDSGWQAGREAELLVQQKVYTS
jgi:hypothetical protein